MDTIQWWIDYVDGMYDPKYVLLGIPSTVIYSNDHVCDPHGFNIFWEGLKMVTQIIEDLELEALTLYNKMYEVPWHRIVYEDISIIEAYGNLYQVLAKFSLVIRALER